MIDWFLKTTETRLSILKAQTRKLKLSDNIDLRKIAEILPDRVTGADIGAITSQAFTHALESKLKRLETDALRFYEEIGESIIDKNIAIASYLNNMKEEELQVVVDLGDFDVVMSTFTPSVSANDLEYYEHMKLLFEA